MNQLESLLSWKKKTLNVVAKQGEYKRYMFDSIEKINLNDYCEDLEVLLINPPWSNKSPMYNFTHLVKYIVKIA